MASTIDMKRLLNAFLELGGDRNGMIEYSILESRLKNDKKMSEEGISLLLESDSCRDGEKLNFLKLVSKIYASKAALNNNNEPEGCLPSTAHSKKINSRTFTRRKGSGRSSSSASCNKKSLEMAELQGWSDCCKGSILNTEDSVLCAHRYQLELPENSPIEIVTQAIDSKGCFSLTPVIEILLFQENNEPNKKLVTFSSFINSKGYTSIKMNLKQGKYLLVPVTLNWRGAVQTEDEDEMEPLTDFNESGEVVLTSTCQQALRIIFDLIDLDRNGHLNQQEFDFFIQHICGESSLDEWSTVEDNFDTFNGQLTFDGFLSLYKIAIITDSQDVLQMFKKMGLNDALKCCRALPFLLTVNASATKPKLVPMPISIFDSLMEEVFRKTAIEQGHCTKIANMNDLFLYTHTLPQRVTLVVRNRSHSKVKIRLDCGKSENCISHQNTLDCTIEVQPKTSMVGHHLFPENSGVPWSVHCVEILM